MEVFILQISDIKNCPYAFNDFTYALDNGFDPNDYDIIYKANLNLKTKNINRILDYLFRRFNEDEKPSNYSGRSIAVSDIVILDKIPYYCNSYKWEKLDGYIS